MGNYQRTQNSQNEGIALAHTLTGAPVQGVGGVQHSQGTVELAGLHSTAPYKPPKRRRRDNPDKLLCSYEDCRAYPMKTQPYCTGHARKLGLIEVWSTSKAEASDGDTG